MSAIAMKVVSAEQHPNADALRLYKMEAPQVEAVQIIANLDNVYQADDVVAVALSGAVLKDGTKIKPSKLRGLYSYGMALGKVDVEIGTDLSQIHCQPQVEEVNNTVKLPFIKWTSIELLHNVYQELKTLGKTAPVTYRAKIKLHGTNAGVRVTPEGIVAAQKRSQIITSKNDNAGFAAWVEQNAEYFSQLKGDRTLTIFGEWCGTNVQKGVAISQIGRKILAVFAIQYGGVGLDLAQLEIRPEKIREVLPEHKDIFVLPYYGEAIALDFGDRDKLQTASETINQMVATVEEIDPWVKATFGVEGVGEGLVMYPEVNELVIREGYTELMFKAKGEQHRAVKTKTAVEVDPAIAKSVQEFVELFVTEARLNQALSEACNGELNIKKMGQFLKWIALDIQKESSAELAAADLTWKQVHKSVSNAAREWYAEKIKEFQ